MYRHDEKRRAKVAKMLRRWGCLTDRMLGRYTTTRKPCSCIVCKNPMPHGLVRDRKRLAECAESVD